MKALEIWLRAAGLLHFAALIASALTPRALDWRTNLTCLHPFLRKLFWVYGIFIVLTILSFGVLTLAFAPHMASGDRMARAVAAVIAVFWLARLAVQLFVFDARPFLTNWVYRVGYHSLTVLFVIFVAIFGAAALRFHF